MSPVPWWGYLTTLALTSLIVVTLSFALALKHDGHSWTRYCPETPLAWVHDPDRLHVKEGCQFVQGTVLEAAVPHPEGDGDLRYLVSLAPSYARLGDGGKIWLEVVPAHQDVVSSPTVGAVVQAVGTHVWDSAHGYHELHPTTWIRIL